MENFTGKNLFWPCTGPVRDCCVVQMNLLYFSKIVVVKSRSEKYLNVFTKISISVPEFDLLRYHISLEILFFNIVADK